MFVIILAKKDLRRLVGDRKALIIHLVLPLVLTSIMGLSFGGGIFGSSKGISAIPLAVVAGDLPELLKDRFAAALTESGFFTVTWADSTVADGLVRQGKVAAALVFPTDFTSRFLRLEDVPLQVWKDPASELKAGIVEEILARGLRRYQAGEAAYLTLWPQEAMPRSPDGQEIWSNEMFSGSFTEVWQRFRSSGGDSSWTMARDQILLAVDHHTTLSEALGASPVELSVHDEAATGSVDTKEKVNLFNYFLPGFSVFFLMFGVAASCRDLHREQKAGTLQRQLLSPMRRDDFLLGKWLSATGQGALMLGVLFLAGGVLFRVNLGPDPYSLIVTVLACCMAAASVFLFLTLISPTEKVMDNLTTVVILISAMVGGNMIPLESLPAWMSRIGQFTFNYWSNLAFQHIMVDDKGVTADFQPLLILFGFAAGLLVINLLIFRLKASRGGLA